MQAARPHRQGIEPKAPRRPGFAIAVGVAAVLAAVLMFKTFGGTSSEESATAPLSPGHPRGGLKIDDAQRARLEGGGWVAEPANGGGAGQNAGSAAARGAAARPGTGAAADPNVADGASGGAPSGSGGAAGGAAVRRGAAAGGSAAAPQRGAGSALPGGMAPGEAIMASGPAQGAGALPGLPNAPVRNAAPGAEPPPPAGADIPVTDLAPPPGGSAIHYPGGYDLATDQGLPLKAAQFFGPDSGAVSFWLKPQWEGSDPSNGSLVQLGNIDPGAGGDSFANANNFSITKDGQSLHFSFADSTGGGVDANAPIDNWQPGERHLVSATWGPPAADGQAQVAFYVDGTLVGQQPYDGTFQLGADSTLRIGTDGRNNPSVPGIINSFNVYKTTLPQELLGQPAPPPAK